MKEWVNIDCNMISILRVLKFALQDMIRNWSLSVMTVMILVLMLLSVNTLVIMRVLTDEASTAIKDQIDVSVYFNQEATQEDIEEIRKYINSFPEVMETTFSSEEQVLKDFQDKHVNNEEILEALNELGENPFGPTIVVKTREPKDYNKIINALAVPEYDTIIEAKTFGDTEKAIQRIDIITSQVERFSMALTILFAVISFIIIFNTIRVSIYTHRIEITIKKLVGASNWFVRGPYIVQSILFSIVSIGITYGLVCVGANFLDPYVSVVFGKYSLLTDFFKSNIIFLFGIQFVSVLFLTIISSAVAMRKYLRA